jgi:uncharacterized protein
MTQPKSRRPRRTDPRGPLIFSVAALSPGSASMQTRTVPAPANLGSGMVRVPEGAELHLVVQLEDVTDGVLVTGDVTAPLTGECARCLGDFTSQLQVRFQELFSHEAGVQDGEGYVLDGNLLDIEPALRDALVLELPLSPLCAPDCRGLCSDCGIRLADAPPGHGHPVTAGRWAALRDFVPARADEQDGAADGTGRPGLANGTGGPTGAKEH